MNEKLPDMTIHVRTATIDDAPLLSELGARLFAQTFAKDNTPEDMATYLAGAFTPERQSAELAEPNRKTWIAEDGNGVAIGYAVLIRGETSEFVDGNRSSELRRIYVDRSLHGRPADGARANAGSLLLETCADQAREWNSEVLWLAVWEKNPRAIRFYEKHGFQPVGRKTFQLGNDTQHDFVMARNL